MGSTLELDITPETAVLRKRPLTTLLEHLSKRAIFYKLCRLRNLITYM